MNKNIHLNKCYFVVVVIELPLECSSNIYCNLFVKIEACKIDHTRNMLISHLGSDKNDLLYVYFMNKNTKSTT